MSVTQPLSSAAVAALLTAATLAGHAQQAAVPVETARIGPQVGTVVPPVSGTDQFGRSHTLSSLSGPKGLMLVFSRSADW